MPRRPLFERESAKEHKAALREQRERRMAALEAMVSGPREPAPPEPAPPAPKEAPKRRRKTVKKASPGSDALPYAVLELLADARGLGPSADSAAKDAASTPSGALRYNPHLAAAVCQLIAEGRGLPEICAMPDMPKHRHIVAWKREVPEFKAMYDEARAMQGDYVADKHLQLANLALRADARVAGAIKIAADILARQAEWRAPRKFGPRMDLTVNEVPKSPEQVREEVLRLQEELGVVENKRIH